MSNRDSYNSFLLQNRKLVNITLNKVLWFCLITAPAIALGIFLGVFPSTTYHACFEIFIAILFLSVVHTLMLRKWPDSLYTSYFILLSLDLLLVQMNYLRINIHITWFFVPLLAILFCNTRFYLFTVVTNYFFVILSVHVTAPRITQIRSDYESVRGYFFNTIGGYTIETLAMTIAGLTVCSYITKYFMAIFEENDTIRDNQEKMSEQLKIQESMASVYDSVNLLDFEKMTEKSLAGDDPTEHSIEGHAHSKLNHRIRKKVIPEQYKIFSEFTDITTIRDRLYGKKSISAEFIHIDTGWFIAQYINLSENLNSLPVMVIYTTQTIDDFKRREEYLLHISTTDELTGLYNRRSYDQDISRYNDHRIEDDLVIISIDVNGLKQVNDTKGHTAGDELIRGAADCIADAISSIGKVYRTGGDEFLAVINTDVPDSITEKIRKNAANWHGELVDALSLSIGYAAHKDYKSASASELEKISDDKMYEDKALYYRTSGKDRRTR